MPSDDRTNTLVLRSAIVAALGGLLFGFDTAVISGGIDAITTRFDLSPTWSGFVVSSALIGTIVGSIGIGKPADALGRRTMMLALAVLFFVSAIGSALAWDLGSLLVFRFIGGLGIGGASVVAPMYISEISPAGKRGRLVALAQLNIVLGILLAFLSNYLVSVVGKATLPTGDPVAAYDTWMQTTGWRAMLGVEAIPAIAYFLLVFTVPRSPRWLIAHGRDEEAAEVLARVGTDQNESVAEEIAEIKASLHSEREALREPFFQAKYMKPIMLAFAIAAFNQLSGINAILYYAPTIFKSAGFGESAGLLNSVGLGLMNLVFTMIGLALIDNFGRKRLMLLGSLGYIVSLGAAAAAFYTQSETAMVDGESVRTFSSAGGWTVFGSLLVFIAAHAVGQGAVIWVFISEIFPNTVRARGQALGSFTHWIFAAAISQTFPMIAEAAGGHVFAFYGLCMVGQLFWVLLLMPETKGIPLEQIQKKLGID